MNRRYVLSAVLAQAGKRGQCVEREIQLERRSRLPITVESCIVGVWKILAAGQIAHPERIGIDDHGVRLYLIAAIGHDASRRAPLDDDVPDATAGFDGG